VTSTGADTRNARTTAPRHRDVGDSAVVAFLSRTTAWILTSGGALGTVAAFALVLDRISLLEDPAFIPSCSISPLLSCGSIMTSPQAEVLGLPNRLIGVVAFPIVTTVGVVALVGGTVPRAVWLGLQLGAAAGLVFVHWLIGQSLYNIGALYPYCMIVWVVTITVFWYVTLLNLAAGHLPVGARSQRTAAHIARYHSTILGLWFLVIVTLIAVRFWPYWVGLVS
jgi:uncharacterized membrane protein